MENIINYYYGIRIKKVDNDIIYDVEDNVFYIKKIEPSKKDRLVYIDSLITGISNNNFYCYRFLRNKYNELFTVVKDDIYIVISLDENYNKELDLTSMIEFYDKSSLLINGLKAVNWDLLWESKLNNLYQKISINQSSNKSIAPLFYYYAGITENAICYLKKNMKTDFQNCRLSFNHYRINYPVRYVDFYNPINLYVDFNIRDISEYIKSVFYSGASYEVELEYFLKVKKIGLHEATLLYSRIIFPSHFIDTFLKDTNKKNYHAFYKTKDYESFLLNTYNVISRYYKIPEISWITDQH